jgi:hypothetical protein
MIHRGKKSFTNNVIWYLGDYQTSHVIRESEKKIVRRNLLVFHMYIWTNSIFFCSSLLVCTQQIGCSTMENPIGRVNISRKGLYIHLLYDMLTEMPMR